MSAGTSGKRNVSGPSRRSWPRRRTKPWPKACWTRLPNCSTNRTPGNDAKAEYGRKRAAFLKSSKRCRNCGASRGLDVHHIRGRLGELLVRQEYWVALCRSCHAWVHDNPTAARERGLLAEFGQWNRA